MLPEEFLEQMKKISESEDYDTEVSHIKADNLLCEVLKGLGYAEGAEIFEAMHKWYY